jgi:hypothetical protein
MTFHAYCPYCETKVGAVTLLGGDELKAALISDADIEVMHLSNNGDHQWKLIKQEKKNLRKTVSEGLL